MPKLFVDPTKDLTPFVVVVDNMADRVQHVSAFVIHVTRTFRMNIVDTDDRNIVVDSFATADNVLVSFLLGKMVFDK